MKNQVIYITLALLSATSLGGCGVKPGSVDPPPGAEQQVYPETYPDTATDPEPVAPEKTQNSVSKPVQF
jgi:hypothetical protein